MKSSLLFLSVSLFLPPLVNAQDNLPHSIKASHDNCRMDFLDQQRQAIRNLLKKAESECGLSAVPIQVTETILQETHSCLHYRRGVQAEATFKCLLLVEEDQ